ncbi:MAG: ATP-binding protein [Desulfobacterales bacterium]|nr:ATP-binding protein [Desulfobacterales bacterium]
MKRIFFTFYCLLILLLVLIPLGIKPLVKALFEDEMVEIERTLARGTFYMIARELDGVDAETQNRILERLQGEFGYPLELHSLDGISIRSADQLDFLGGMIVWDAHRNLMVLRIGNSQRALAIGPFPGRELINRAGIYFWAFCMICLILPALVWTWFIRKDVRQIERKAARFFNGDLAARAHVPHWSSMREVVRTVNTMADKAQKLIGYQKSFANAVSHEIRTPLARIKFSLEMMDGPSDPNDTDYRLEIGRDVEEIEGLVDEMLTYARFERDLAATADLPVNDMVSWLKNLVVREQKTQSAKELILRLPPGEPPLSHAFEATYLGWAVRNLIRNGLRHARSRVTVVLEPGTKEIALHVDDDGPGIPEEMREKVFVPFFRLDGSRNRSSGGYGLGLAIAGRIVAWHGGGIRIFESAQGGARFTLCLPREGRRATTGSLWGDGDLA